MTHSTPTRPDAPTDTPRDAPMDPAADPLVAAAVAGDARALEELLATHGPRVRAGLSIGRERRRDLDADDVMQVTYLEAYLRIRGLRTPTAAAFVRWLERIAHNNLTDAIRALSRARRPDARERVTQGEGGESSRTLLERLAVSGTTAGGLAQAAEAREIVRACIARLPASYREVLEACDLEERPVAEVARERGTSPGAVHMLRSRAQDRLRELLASRPELFGKSP